MGIHPGFSRNLKFFDSSMSIGNSSIACWLCIYTKMHCIILRTIFYNNIVIMNVLMNQGQAHALFVRHSLIFITAFLYKSNAVFKILTMVFMGKSLFGSTLKIFILERSPSSNSGWSRYFPSTIRM